MASIFDTETVKLKGAEWELSEVKHSPKFTYCCEEEDEHGDADVVADFKLTTIITDDWECPRGYSTSIYLCRACTDRLEAMEKEG